MNTELQLLRAGEKVIADRFGMESAVGDVWDDVRIFRLALIARIQWLLNDHLERLMHILYLVDVDEALTRRVFSDSPPANIAATLADLIIERQLEKVRTRAQHRNDGGAMLDAGPP